MNEPLRTFIALEPPQAILAELEQRQAELRKRLAERGLERHFTWSRPAGFHLTLRFLGDTPASQRAAIAQGLARLAREHAPFRLALGPAGVFPNWSRVRVVWVGLSGDQDALARLQAAVEALARSVGFVAERRPFSPHITLARSRRGIPPEELRRAAAVIRGWAETPPPPSTLDWRVTAVHYIHSRLTPQGARYTTLGRFQLGSGHEEAAPGPR